MARTQTTGTDLTRQPSEMEADSSIEEDADAASVEVHDIHFASTESYAEDVNHKTFIYDVNTAPPDPPDFHPNGSAKGFKKRPLRSSSTGNSKIKSSPDIISEEEDDYNCYYEDPILLPQSTHSLLFTEEICSAPFNYSLLIILLSLPSLVLALVNNLSEGTPGNPLGLPVQVDTSVRITQYIAIGIGLIMEQEIPSSFYLLQMIPKFSLKQNLPRLKYWRFVTSAVLRLLMGYVFMLNMFLVIAQGDGVLDIFYDCLALQFLQELDDIAFRLARMNALGKRLKWATNKKIFMVEFDRPPFASRKKISVSLKILYVLNLSAMLGGMIWVSVQQISGSLNCNNIFVTFAEDIWEDAMIKRSSKGFEQRVLIYSYFNGVYKRNGTHDGLPVYTEQSKVTGETYQITTGAEIKYCKREGAWVFMHPLIRKSKQDDNDCPWLLRSPETTDYDLLSVTGAWTVWAGSFKKAGAFSALCDECSTISECNYHGQCINRKCHCANGQFFGHHCEHRRPCKTLRGDMGDIWSVRTFDEMSWNPSSSNTTLVIAYDRPTYKYESGLPFLPQDAILVLVYTGSRWFLMNFTEVVLSTPEHRRVFAREFHAFWGSAYTGMTRFVSDSATESSPIAVDFYNITDRGPRYGPLGQLTPLADPAGSGYFECEEYI